MYLRKELLWPHIREFADRTIEHILCAPSLLLQSANYIGPRPQGLAGVGGLSLFL